MSRALVTGGGGFIGSHLVERLRARGDEVTILARGHYPALEARGVRAIRGDVTDPEVTRRACEGADVIFHVAAKASVGVDLAAYAHTNVEGTRTMLASAQAVGVTRFVHTSTPSVVFSEAGHVGADERAPLTTSMLSPYAYTKARAEELVRAAATPTFRTVALRPHLVWGPRDPQLTARLVDRARRGKLALVGDGTALVDTTFVDNAVDAHLLAGDALARPDAPANGQAYFISNGEPRAVEAIVGDIVAACGAPRPTRHVPLAVAYGLGALIELVFRLIRSEREPPMSRFLAINLATPHWFDLSAARRDLGYAPRVSVAEGLERLAAWSRSGGGES
jgi:nucleoside-diphosphate-sugar epimerase